MPDISFPSDPPNNPAQPLPQGPLEPLQFTTVRPLVFLLVDVGQGEECAYRDGAFRGPYAGVSSYASNSGVLFRQGGWPAPPKVIGKVEALPPPPPAGGQPWRAIYQVDLNAQAAQAIGGPGEYTIAGLKWWAKGALAFNQELGLVNGAGLKHGNSNNGNSSLELPGGNGVPAFSIYFFPFDQIDGYNPLAPVAVQFRASGNTLGGSNVRLTGGVISAAKSAAAWNTRTSQMLAGVHGNSSICWMDGGGSWASTFTGLGYSADGSNRPIAVVRATKRLGVCGVDTWGGDFTDIDALESLVAPGLTAQAPSVPGFFYAASAPATQSITSYLRQLRVLQPQVPA